MFLDSGVTTTPFPTASMTMSRLFHHTANPAWEYSAPVNCLTSREMKPLPLYRRTSPLLICSRISPYWKTLLIIADSSISKAVEKNLSCHPEPLRFLSP